MPTPETLAKHISEVTLSFDYNGVDGWSDPVTVEIGGTYSGLGSVTLHRDGQDDTSARAGETTVDGLTFDGWYTLRYGGDPVTDGSPVTRIGDHTLYAHWTSDEPADPGTGEESVEPVDPDAVPTEPDEGGEPAEDTTESGASSVKVPLIACAVSAVAVIAVLITAFATRKKEDK